MLSGETAMGDYPLECVNTMVKVAKSVEPTINYWKRFTKKDWKIEEADIESHAAYTTCVTARDIKADAIIDYTHTGNSARRLAGYGPASNICYYRFRKSIQSIRTSLECIPNLSKRRSRYR